MLLYSWLCLDSKQKVLFSNMFYMMVGELCAYFPPFKPVGPAMRCNGQLWAIGEMAAVCLMLYYLSGALSQLDSGVSFIDTGGRMGAWYICKMPSMLDSSRIRELIYQT